MGKKELDTEQRILEAAKKVFVKKGHSGARMQEIADLAEINKGLLHYYFKSKDKLFDKIFGELIKDFIPDVNTLFESDLPLLEKIRGFINRYMDMLIKNPYLPGFIFHELNKNPDKFIDKVLKGKEKPNPLRLMMQIQLETQLGKIKPVNPMQLLLNMVSMCVFPFIGKPILQTALNISEKEFLMLMELRKKEVYNFIEAALKV